MKESFKKGFMKTAASVLAELSLNSNDSKEQAERQLYLENSYARERGEEPANTLDAVEEDSSLESHKPQYANLY